MTIVQLKYNTPALLFTQDGLPTHLLHSVYTFDNEMVYFVYDKEGVVSAWHGIPSSKYHVKIIFTDQLLPLNEWIPLWGAPINHCGLNKNDMEALALSEDTVCAVLDGQTIQPNTAAKGIVVQHIEASNYVAEIFMGLEMDTPIPFFDDTLETCAHGHTFSLYHQLCYGCKNVICPAEGCDQVIPIAAYRHIMGTLSPTLHPFLIDTAS
jgi:hypothetical protein